MSEFDTNDIKVKVLTRAFFLDIIQEICIDIDPVIKKQRIILKVYVSPRRNKL